MDTELSAKLTVVTLIRGVTFCAVHKALDLLLSYTMDGQQLEKDYAQNLYGISLA